MAGATGFIGTRLVPALLTDGARVRCLVRDPVRAREVLPPEAELVEGDLDAGADLAAAMEGVELAYFLVHMLDAGADYPEREVRAAERFAGATSRAGVGRLVYLGGLGSDRGTSTHLDSRHATAKALRREGPALTYFRAAMIVGPQSESYVLLKSIVARLRALPSPEWLGHRTQPIGIRDVVSYLRQAPSIPESAGREIQIGGPDRLTHLEVVDRLAEEMGHRRPLRVPVPDSVVSPGVVAAAAAIVTRGDAGMASALSHGLVEDTVVTDPSGAAMFDVRPERLGVVVQRCLAEEEGNRRHV